MPRIKIWVCDNCGNYYGSKSDEHIDLSKQIVGEKDANFTPTPNKAHPRSRCPDCSSERKPRFVTIDPAV